MVSKDYTEIKECRICKGKNLISYLDLGDMPLVNKVLTKEEIPSEKKYPLNVLFCKDCNLSQLSIVLNPEILFKNYVYRSSISDSFKEHCNDLAEELNKDVLQKGDMVVDIASNDGCLLMPFKERKNKVLGIDPAVNLAKIANELGIETLPKFWEKGLAKKILNEYGPAKIITAKICRIDHRSQYFPSSQSDPFFLFIFFYLCLFFYHFFYQNSSLYH